MITHPQTVFCKPQYKLSVVIPAYNEEKRLEFMLNDAFKSLVRKTKSDPTYNCEIILVDDGSKDETIKEYRRIISLFPKNSRIDFKLLKLGINSGKGKAVSEVFDIKSFLKMRTCNHFFIRVYWPVWVKTFYLQMRMDRLILNMPWINSRK